MFNVQRKSFVQRPTMSLRLSPVLSAIADFEKRWRRRKPCAKGEGVTSRTRATAAPATARCRMKHPSSKSLRCSANHTAGWRVTTLALHRLGLPPESGTSARPSCGHDLLHARDKSWSIARAGRDTDQGTSSPLRACRIGQRSRIRVVGASPDDTYARPVLRMLRLAI